RPRGTRRPQGLRPVSPGTRSWCHHGPRFFLSFSRRTRRSSYRDHVPPTPPELPDLDEPGDVAELVRRFYADVAQDDLLGPLFNDVARVDWSEHLPKLTAFWCRALFGIEGYVGNPFRAHLEVHARSPFTLAHFHR